MPAASTSDHGLRGLVQPVFVPSFVYSVGVGAAAPAVILVGASIGLTTSEIALLVAAAAGVGLLGTLAAGQFVAHVGERSALVSGTALSTVTIVALCIEMWSDLPGRTVAFASAVTIGAAVDGVWSVARQALLAETVPVNNRGRALTTYAAVQRAGRACGPLIGGAAILALGPAAGLAMHGVAGVVACALLVRHLPRAASARREVDCSPPSARIRPSTFWILGSSMLVLDLVRTNRDLLLATVGLHDVGLDPAQVSLAASVGLWFELALFWPAGRASDRFGPSLVAAVSLATMAIGLLALTAPGTGTFWVAMAVLGLGNGIGAGMIKTIGVTLAPPQSPARFLGRWTAFTSGGSLAGPALLACTPGVGSATSITALLAVGAAGILARSGSRLLGSTTGPGEQSDS